MAGRVSSHGRDGGRDHGVDRGVIATVVATGLLGPGAAQPIIRESVCGPDPDAGLCAHRPVCGVRHSDPAAPPLADVLERPLGADALGDSVAVSVVDLSTGTRLFTADADAALIPASTMKILTAAAALQAGSPTPVRHAGGRR